MSPETGDVSMMGIGIILLLAVMMVVFLPKKAFRS